MDLELQEERRLPAVSALRHTSKAQTPRLLLDLSTSLAWLGKHANGIIRTEREIAARLLRSTELCVIPVVYHDHEWRALEPEFARILVTTPLASTDVSQPSNDIKLDAPNCDVKLDAPDTELIAPAIEVDAASRRGWSARIIGPMAVVARLIARNLVNVIPKNSREEVRQVLIDARQMFRRWMYPPAEPKSPAEPGPPAKMVVRDEPSPEVTVVDEPRPDLTLVVHPQRTDVLFLCGLGWDVIDWRRLASLREESGMRIVSIVYDLVAIKFPEFFAGRGDLYFNYFLHIIDNCDKLLCISKCTQTDTAEFIANQGRPPVAMDIVYLGANVPAEPNPAEIVEPTVRERLRRGRFALVVGTFEIRKNHSLLIDVWKELLPDPTFDLDLVIVGMPGWNVDNVIAGLEGLPSFGSRIFWFKLMSDAGLSWLYEHCLVVLYPSLYEGWGLPVVEALQHRRPVITSNRGATPEAGFGIATILDPDDHAAWCAAVLAVSRAPRQVVEIEFGRLPDWDDTAAQVERGIMDIMRTEAALQ